MTAPLIPPPPLALHLADLIGGEFDGETKRIKVGADFIECRPTGQVVMNTCLLLGHFSDGPELLAAEFRAVAA